MHYFFIYLAWLKSLNLFMLEKALFYYQEQPLHADIFWCMFLIVT